MRFFRIIDSRKPKRAKPCGVLIYDENKRTFSIEIAPDADGSDVPLMFVPFIEQKCYTIPPEWALAWIQERIVPSTRQNIGEVLEANNLIEYDELALLLAGEGRCSKDDFMVQEVQFEPDKNCFEYAIIEVASGRRDELACLLAGEVVRLRKERGYSQDELSHRSGVPRAMISRIEHGLANPTLATMAMLADGLDSIINFSLS